ncbi:MAG: MFS transporter [Coriobacteriales bacterium]|jgi:MFS family permease|nr:MFS transporter [Coriobacteriales bacterium]
MATPVNQKRLGIHYAWWIMIGCCFLQAGALGAVLNSSGVFFPAIVADLGFTQGGISSYLTFYSWATCVGMLLVARFFPRVDTRILMSGCTILIVLALGLMSVYTELWQWYLSGVVFGLAGSFIFVVPAPVLIGNWFAKKTGFATGFAMAFSGIGAAVFSPLFTAFIEAFGWRSTYVVVAVIVAVLVLPWTVFVFRFKPEDLGMQPYGHEEAQGDTPRQTISTAGATLKKALPTLSFVALLVFAGLTAFYSGYNNQLPTFAISRGFDPLFGATLISAAMLGNIASKLIMGVIIELLGVLRTTVLTLVLIALAMLMFVFLRAEWALYCAAFFYGSQNALVSVSTPLIIKDIFGNKNYTEIYAFVRLGTGIIGGIGISVVAIAFDVFGSYDPAFYGGVALSAAAILCVTLAYAGKKKVVWEEEGIPKNSSKPVPH